MHVITSITGASGALYGKRFVQVLNEMGHQQTLLITGTAREVLNYELNLEIPARTDEAGRYLVEKWSLPNPHLINFEDINNLHAAIASGSRAPEAMVIIPCTMGTVARVTQGLSSNLLERAFDVMLKEKRKVIVVPRETPISQIHLRNLLELSKLGVDIIPAMPAFYHKPEQIMDLVDFLVGRVIEHLGLKHSLYKKWQGHKK